VNRNGGSHPRRYDGKWVLHPDQIDAANEVFAPLAADFERASRIVEAYAHATGVQARGAVCSATR
jgi:citrate lyase subunit beta/citryl-CoA lyase